MPRCSTNWLAIIILLLCSSAPGMSPWFPAVQARSRLYSAKKGGHRRPQIRPRNFIGVNIGDGYSIDGVEAASEAAKLNVTHLKFFRTNATEIKALENFKVMVCIKNDRLFQYANTDTGLASAIEYVQQNILPYPQVYAIAIGNEPFGEWYKEQYTGLVYPTMKNVGEALRINNLDQRVQVVVPLDYACLFRTDFQTLISPILRFLAGGGYPFVVNIYPEYPCMTQADLSISFCLGTNSRPLTRRGPLSMLQAQVKTAQTMLAKFGYPRMSIVVGETGWASTTPGGDTQVNNLLNMQLYINSVLKYVNNGGVPLFLFQLQDGYDDHYGLLTNPMVEQKFPIPLLN